MKSKNVCGIANSILAKAVVLVTTSSRHFFLFDALTSQSLSQKARIVTGREAKL